MKQLDLTLIADGSSDEVLVRIIEWLFYQFSSMPLNTQFAYNVLPSSRGLNARVVRALELYPCDILVVHRDAENATPAHRCSEITQACKNVFEKFVPIVPVRMTEAWLLGSETAIRKAAENAAGTAALNLPVKRLWETIPDPKSRLHELLRIASSRSRRRLAGQSIGRWVARTADLIDDWSFLRGLSSFDAFETAFRVAFDDVVQRHGRIQLRSATRLKEASNTC